MQVGIVQYIQCSTGLQLGNHAISQVALGALALPALTVNRLPASLSPPSWWCSIRSCPQSSLFSPQFSVLFPLSSPRSSSLSVFWLPHAGPIAGCNVESTTSPSANDNRCQMFHMTCFISIYHCQFPAWISHHGLSPIFWTRLCVGRAYM